MKLSIGDQVHNSGVDRVYHVAWDTLEMVFGEQMNQEALETMKAVLKGVKSGLKDDVKCKTGRYIKFRVKHVEVWNHKNHKSS